MKFKEWLLERWQAKSLELKKQSAKVANLTAELADTEKELKNARAAQGTNYKEILDWEVFWERLSYHIGHQKAKQLKRLGYKPKPKGEPIGS